MKKGFALLMSAVLVLYVILMFQRAVDLVRSGEVVGIVMGIALFVFPLIGMWALIAEVTFGFRLEKLVKRLDSENGMPEPLPASASGRADLDAALEAFPKAREDVHAHPESWQSWLRLSMAYDAARDRRRARKAARKAIELSRRK